MGTSKAYGSPKWPGVNSAVGEAVSSGMPTPQKILNAVSVFTGAYKKYLTSSTSNYSTVDRNETDSSGHSGGRGGGGSGSATRGRSAATGAQLGHFLNTMAQSGLNAALIEFNLSELKDKPLNEFLDAVKDRLSSEGGLIDDGTLNQAMSRTIDEVAKDVNSVDQFDQLFEQTNINIEEILQIYYTNILILNFEQKEYGIVREKIARENTSAFFENARNLVRSIVRDELSHERDLSTIDWNSAEGRTLADKINQEVLDILIPNE